ncbi:MAG: DNA-directed RNA polymerase subunit A' [Methanobacteriota archaeon]|nr:MAG: DNA-directed RNA polymerase subunit A' [Euryarchaeota archaeon]
MLLHYTPTEFEIKKLKFSVFSSEMIMKMSKAKITVPDTYDDDGYPIDGGLMDQRLGVIDPGLRCKTCGGTSKQCPGHFGNIDLVRPVVHPHFAKDLLKILNKICINCSKYIGSAKATCPHCKEALPKITLSKPTTFLADKVEILPTDLKEILAQLSDEDVRKLGYDPIYSRPEWFIVSVILVPSVKMRPSITLESGDKSEDDLTHKLVEIIRVNEKLEANINAGAPQLIIEDLWKLLQYHVTTYFDNETAGIPPARHRSGRPLKTIAQRLKGKEGRFRYNLSGKRVNFSARTVISPDPMISINEVGVPPHVANILTVPVPVTEWNIEELKKLIESDEYPRALYVIRKDGIRMRVTETSREKILESLGVGWVVERQLKDGDIVLFNRQPSLHRISMMAHIVKILPGKTFRINPIVVPPYNADFDGDEMNLHALQTEEARVEAHELMKVERQILSPRHGRAIIKPTEDNVTGVYLITRDDAIFTKEQAARLLYVAGITEMPKPDVDGKLYSGRLLFSLLLPPGINVRRKSKMGNTVVVKDGNMISGTLDEDIMDHDILEQVFSKHGSEVARHFLDNVTKMSLEYLTLTGFTVSLKDYSLNEKAEKKRDELLADMDKEIDKLINKYLNKTLERAPGMTLKQTLESLIMMITSQTRDAMGKLVENSFGLYNPSIVMAKIGARGSILNAIQMSGVVGQQAIRNKRPHRGYYKRTLAFYKKGDLSGRARGFVYGHFSEGLEVDEFFLHAMAGRDATVNTAIRTARSGYMQRRLINALQDFVVTEDRSTRDAGDRIIQFVYGGDERDPMYSAVKEFEEPPKEDAVDTAV